MPRPTPRILVLAQGFKGTLRVGEVAAGMEQGVRAAGAEPVVLCASDGGDGLLEALADSFSRYTSHAVTGPLGTAVDASVGWFDAHTAVIESRLVCGLSLVPVDQRDPLRSTTRGVGELVTELSASGARTVLIGLGGSATVDGGMGMARAWGFIPLDEFGRELPEGGGALRNLARFETGRAPGVQLIGLADVRNPMTGERGAVVYAPQKGAGPDAIDRLERGLERLAAVSARDDLARAPMAGAAGGLGFGILFFGRGTLAGGAAWFLERLRIAEHLKDARLVVTGEGAFDATSLEGKLSGEVLGAAARAGVPAALLAPRADRVPAGVQVESGGGEWDAGELARRTKAVVERALRAGSTR